MSGLPDDVAGGAATTDPPDHARQRKVVVRRLSTSSIQAMEPQFRALVADALSDVGADGRFEWMSRVAEPLPMIMVARVLGLPDALAPGLKKQGYSMVERISGFVPEERIGRLEDDGVNSLAPVIEAYMQAGEEAIANENGLIGIVKRAVDDGELNDLEAFGILSVVIAAGGESTTSLTGTAVRILAERPDLQDELRCDPALVPTFIEEALRYDSPFRGHYRVATRDIELGGKPIPAGSHLFLRKAGIGPAPRHHGPTWGQFLRLQAEGILVWDFFTVETITLTRLYCFAVVERASRPRSAARVS